MVFLGIRPITHFPLLMFLNIMSSFEGLRTGYQSISVLLVYVNYTNKNTMYEVPFYRQLGNSPALCWANLT